MTVWFAYIFVTYSIGTAMGYALYRNSLTGRIAVAFDELLTEMRKAELAKLRDDQPVDPPLGD